MNKPSICNTILALLAIACIMAVSICAYASFLR